MSPDRAIHAWRPAFQLNVMNSVISSFFGLSTMAGFLAVLFNGPTDKMLTVYGPFPTRSCYMVPFELAILSLMICMASCQKKDDVTQFGSLSEAYGILTNTAILQETFFAEHGEYFRSIEDAQCSFHESDFLPTPELRDWHSLANCNADRGGACPIGRLVEQAQRAGVGFRIVVVGWSPELDCIPPPEYIRRPDTRWWYAVVQSPTGERGHRWVFWMSSESKEQINVRREFTHGAGQ